ncbi:MAG: type II toxin-antitoxin system death-on-curing family toxin [Opitutales bacterium]
MKKLHRDSLEREGGGTGIRDEGVLEAAVYAPQATFGGKLLHSSVEAVAAAYLFYLCQNHPLVDGNKQCAARSALIFFDACGLVLQAGVDQLETLVLGIAAGQISKDALTEFFVQRAMPGES